jgi:ribosome-associated translation inhibitor RaiA
MKRNKTEGNSMDISVSCSDVNMESELKEYTHYVFEQIQSISPAGSHITLFFSTSDQGITLDVQVESHELHITKKLRARSMFVAIDRAVGMLKDDLQAWWHQRHAYV